MHIARGLRKFSRKSFRESSFVRGHHIGQRGATKILAKGGPGVSRINFASRFLGDASGPQWIYVCLYVSKYALMFSEIDRGMDPLQLVTKIFAKPFSLQNFRDFVFRNIHVLKLTSS